jgi:hypothetical protein
MGDAADDMYDLAMESSIEEMVFIEGLELPELIETSSEGIKGKPSNDNYKRIRSIIRWYKDKRFLTPKQRRCLELFCYHESLVDLY